MKRLFKVFFVLFGFFHAKAQFINGADFTGTANAAVAQQGIWANNANAAGLTKLTAPAIALAHENQFSVKGLSSKSAAIAIPAKNHVWGTSFQSYGIKEYAITKASVSLAKSFDKKFAVAITLNYHQLSIAHFENAKAFSVETGIQYEPLAKLRLGAHIANPNQNKFSSHIAQPIPSHIKFGAAYLFSDKLTTVSEIEKIIENQLDFKLGINYQIIKYLAFRGGISVNSFKQYGGFGLNYQKIILDFAVSSHPILGYSPLLSLGYEF